MILHTDRYFEQVYDVKHDLLQVNWMNIETLFLPEIKHSVEKLVENIKNFDVHYLLIDGSKIYEHASPDDNKAIVEVLFGGLALSRLKKMARVRSFNSSRERILKQKLPKINKNSTFEFRIFDNLATAYAWLQLPEATVAASGIPETI